jgi:LysM repeat protein
MGWDSGKGGCMWRKGLHMTTWVRKPILFLILISCGSLLGGCVVLEEKYSAEKARSLNFQRLLAQEEKRTTELDSEVKRTKVELAEFEARNRELSVQVQAAREQMGRLQEEAEAIKEATLLERKALDDMRRRNVGPVSPKSQKPEAIDQSANPPADLLTDGPKSGALKESAASGSKSSAKSRTLTHVVKPGDTLFRIARGYGIDVEKLRKMNKLPDDVIEVGQKLVVGKE